MTINVTDRFTLFDPSQPPGQQWTSLAKIPEKVGLPVAAVAYRGDKPYIYLFGGWKGGEVSDMESFLAGVSDKIYAYDITNNLWEGKGTKPTKRIGCSISVVNGNIYIVGGLNTTPAASDKNECYDPETDEWSTKTSLPYGCVFPASAVAKTFNPDGSQSEKIIIIGGNTATDLTTLEGAKMVTSAVSAYDPVEDTWYTCNDINPPARCGSAAGVIENSIYLVGGFVGLGASMSYSSREMYTCQIQQSHLPGPYFICGYVQDSEGTGLGGVILNLSGNTTALYSTETDGYYEFAGLSAGNYTVTPSKRAYGFDPLIKNYKSLNSNHGSQDFIATLLHYYIKGYVRDSSGVGLSDVTMSLTGDAVESTTTASDGYYEFLDLLGNGDYTVTPTKTGYTFSPLNISITSLSGNLDNQDFAGRVIPAPEVASLTADPSTIYDTYTGTITLRAEVTNYPEFITEYRWSVAAPPFAGARVGSFVGEMRKVRTSSTTYEFYYGYSFPEGASVGTYTIQFTVVAPVSIEKTIDFVVTETGKEEEQMKIGNNIFNPIQGGYCTIFYTNSQGREVTAKIYDISGDLVKDGLAESRENSLRWDGTNDNGQIVASDLYFVVIRIGDWIGRQPVEVIK